MPELVITLLILVIVLLSPLLLNIPILLALAAGALVYGIVKNVTVKIALREKIKYTLQVELISSSWSIFTILLMVVAVSRGVNGLLISITVVLLTVFIGKLEGVKLGLRFRLPPELRARRSS